MNALGGIRFGDYKLSHPPQISEQDGMVAGQLTPEHWPRRSGKNLNADTVSFLTRGGEGRLDLHWHCNAEKPGGVQIITRKGGKTSRALEKPEDFRSALRVANLLDKQGTLNPQDLKNLRNAIIRDAVWKGIPLTEMMQEHLKSAGKPVLLDRTVIGLIKADFQKNIRDEKQRQAWSEALDAPKMLRRAMQEIVNVVAAPHTGQTRDVYIITRDGNRLEQARQALTRVLIEEEVLPDSSLFKVVTRYSETEPGQVVGGTLQLQSFVTTPEDLIQRYALAYRSVDRHSTPYRK